nr:MAG TPA: DNA-directed RNA polymerase [Caudoviricetes sp.]
MGGYFKNLLTLETYVCGKCGRTYIRNYVVGDRRSVVSECGCTFYRSIIDASKYDYIYDIVSKVYGLDSLELHDIRYLK